MLRIVFRKMLNNQWMILCLLIGSILAVAMVSSIPVYSDGVLQRMLTKDLESFQLGTEVYPGRYYVEGSLYSLYKKEDRAAAYRAFNKKITGEIADSIGLPYVAYTQDIAMDFFSALPEVQREEEPMTRNICINGIQGLADHVQIVHGRMYSAQKTDGLYEVIVTEQAMRDLDLRLNEVYIVNDLVGRTEEPMKFKIVGVFSIKYESDPFWFQGLWAYKANFIMDFDLLRADFIDRDTHLITSARWYYAFDYHKMTLSNINRVISSNEKYNRFYSQYGSLDYRFPAIGILQKYSARESQLKLTLWVLQVPILLMLAFYLFMVSQLIIENEKNEIAVMKSRGAGGGQIFITYLLESLILSFAALVAGPPLGLLFCSILGSSNGFLEFVQRSALPLSLSPRAYLYSLWAVLLFMVTMLIPAISASKTTIVKYKQGKARERRKPVWQKFFLDIMLLAISAYGLYSYNKRQDIVSMTGVEGTELSADPLLFLISTLFIIGAGLLFLRFYPLIVKLIFWAGKKIWSPTLYASFIQVGRSGGQNQFLMLFIIVTLSIGIFNANAARTLNTNYEEQIRYQYGTDIIAFAYWPDNRPPAGMGPMTGPGQSSKPAQSSGPVQYQEPPFAQFRNIKGVESATKVFVKKDVLVTGVGERAGNVRIMGIIPDEFGRTAWFRSGMLPYHFNEYLNLMAQDPRAMLLSTSFKEKYGYKEGDSIFVTWGDQGFMEGIIYAFVDYWPTYNPNMKRSNGDVPDFVVASYSYIRAKMALEPYQIWLSKAPDATSKMIYDDIEEKKIKITDLIDTDQMIISMKNDPMVQGMNGVLTLGFIVTMAVSTIGFLIYWILSIQKRVLNFGIFRAMGLSAHKIIGMLICEQILISGTAIAVGIVTGGIAGQLFVPLLQIANNAAQQVPPFHVVTDGSDYMRIYGVVAAMLSMAIAALGVIISRIKMAQAIKLGED